MADGGTTSSANTIVLITSAPSTGADRGDVLLVAHHEPADGHLVRRLHRPRQQHVRLRGLVGSHDVRRVEVHRVDLVEVDELLEVDASSWPTG